MTSGVSRPRASESSQGVMLMRVPGGAGVESGPGGGLGRGRGGAG